MHLSIHSGDGFFFAALQNSIEYTASHPSCTGVQGAKNKRTNWRFGKKPTDVRSQEEGSMVSSEFHCMHKGRRTQYSVGTTWRVREKNRDRGCTICGQERRKFTKCNAVSLTFHRGFHSSCEWLSVRGWWLVPIFFFLLFSLFHDFLLLHIYRRLCMRRFIMWWTHSQRTMPATSQSTRQAVGNVCMRSMGPTCPVASTVALYCFNLKMKPRCCLFSYLVERLD